ncbi:ferredoxin [Saccharopolyspora shandongensis]|uniref:ferredoxin n=1 Tax=Saccharopolyspora shandongensis TaxID=418495 RepID=UPI0033EEFDAF
MPRNLKLSVDRGLCTSNGLCEHLAGEIFQLDGYRLAVAKVPQIEENVQLWDAVESCPVAAISVVDADTDEALYP